MPFFRAANSPPWKTRSRWPRCTWPCHAGHRNRRSIRQAWSIIRIAAGSSQYTSNDYTDLLKARGIDISVSRKGNPWDNSACQSFKKTLKYEEVLRNDYRNLAEGRTSIAEFLDKLNNHERLHSAPAYMPPAKFEAAHKKEAVAR